MDSNTQDRIAALARMCEAELTEAAEAHAMCMFRLHDVCREQAAQYAQRAFALAASLRGT